MLVDGVRDEVNSLVESTKPVHQETQKMERFGMFRFQLERETIGLFRFREPASLMVGLTLIEKRTDS